jgi:hypothetical protein
MGDGWHTDCKTTTADTGLGGASSYTLPRDHGGMGRASGRPPHVAHRTPGLQPTPASLRSCLAPAARRGSPRAFGIQTDRTCIKQAKRLESSCSYERTQICLMCSPLQRLKPNLSQNGSWSKIPRQTTPWKCKAARSSLTAKTGMRSIARPYGYGPNGLPCCILGHSQRIRRLCYAHPV